MMPQKRRRVGKNSKDELKFETYFVSSISSGDSGACNHLQITSCQSDYQMYDMSAALEESPPPCHHSTFSFDKWTNPDVTLTVGDFVVKAHKKHLAVCCRYFDGMFGNNMSESKKREITIHGVDEASFRTIITSFYTGILSVCSQCVIRILRTGTFLQSDVVNEVCENYMLSHMELGTVFNVFDIAAELGYERTTTQAIKLICSNLGPDANLFVTEDFLNLTPSRMSLLLEEDWATNCRESELAAAVLRWAARTWEWYDILSPTTGHVTSPQTTTFSLEYPGYNTPYKYQNHYNTPSSTSHYNTLSTTPHYNTPSSSSSGSSFSPNDSGIVVGEGYFVELSDLEIPSPPPSLSPPPPPSLPPPPPPPGTPTHYTQLPARARRTAKTYKRRGSRSATRSRKTPDSSSKRKRKREEDSEDTDLIRGLAQVQQGQREISEVLEKLEFNNMEVETLRGFLKLDIVTRIPELYAHLRRLVGAVRYKCYPERGSKISVSLCYHRSYRTNMSPTRTVQLYYYNNNRWHTLDNTFNINLISVKSVILHNFLYVFGMQKLPGQQHAEPRAFRFNQFTGVWREIAVPPHSFNANSRCLVYRDTILLIGSPCMGAGLTAYQNRNVKILQYIPHLDAWQQVEADLPITNHQLQRYVSSIIVHDNLLYYISSNYLCSFDIEAEQPRQREVAIISQMFTDISGYWLFAHRDKIVLLGGLMSMQGGGSWQNREILIYNLTQQCWTVIQNHKPSPMYEMLSGMIYREQIYTVSHSASGGESVAKIELFDLNKQKWRKGTTLKYESPVSCIEYGLTVGSMLVKPHDSD